jgi:hypothetical protein
MNFEELAKRFEQEQKQYDCRACEIEANDEPVKQKPRHTCGKDGPNDDHLNQLKKAKA